MIFTSLLFVFCFLPVAVLGYGLFSTLNARAGSFWLIFASLVFYGFWAPYLIVLISTSILFNYAISVAIRRSVNQPRWQTALLTFGIVGDLTALFYYKYAFAVFSFLDGYHFVSPLHGMAAVVLPLGISFFTFTQIGYLVDCKGGVTKDNNFIDYVLFVTFFPHLIAGPILHNGEMMPQFANPANRRLQAANMAPGITLFVLGMLKKSIFADPLSPIVAAGFAHAGTSTVFASWMTILSYSVQLYFDFSGYSDMAIALAMLFNIRFPANFNSPYKARNIIDFWQRWHMSLTRYLNQYLYNPIALATRRRRARRGHPMSRKALQKPGAFFSLVAYPTIATMGIAGVWHGAGLQFVVFGVLHGVYLTINHAWHMYGPKPAPEPRSRMSHVRVTIFSMALTYLGVLLGQVFFRAASCKQALDLLAGMLGFHGLAPELIATTASSQHGLIGRTLFGLHQIGITGDDFYPLGKLTALFLIIWFAPNTQQIMAAAKPILGVMPNPAPRSLQWQSNLRWAALSGVLAYIAVMSLGGTTEFLYFKF